jgi:uncharacterized membrane protein
MLSTYGWLKLVHVLSVVVWIGGVPALWTVAIRLGRAGNRAGLATVLPIVARYGQTMAGPSSLVVLVTGIVMIIVGRLGSPLWVKWGMVGILLHFVLGATLIRRNWMEVGRLASASPPDDARLAAMVRRTSLTNWTYLLLMVSVIVVMVLKPTG